MILAPIPEVVSVIEDCRGVWFGYQARVGFLIWPLIGRHHERASA